MTIAPPSDPLAASAASAGMPAGNDALLRLTHAEHARGDLASAWQRIIDEFDTYRPLLIAQVEAWGTGRALTRAA